jgi:hypothetical protein
LARHAGTSEKEPKITDNARETRVFDAVVTLVDSLLDDFDVVDLLTELAAMAAMNPSPP